MKSAFSQKLRRNKMSKKFHLHYRDFVVIDIIKSGPAASLQTTVKKISPHGAIVQFKYLPKLRKMKPTDPKFPYVLEYKIAQCKYLFEFEPTEHSKLPKNQELSEDPAAMRQLTKLKRLRAQEIESSCHDLDVLLKQAREGELVRPPPASNKRKENSKDKKAKAGKEPDHVARRSKADVLMELIDLFVRGRSDDPMITENHIKDLIKMIFKNVNREVKPHPPLPALRVFPQTARMTCDEIDFPEESWPHLKLVYNLLARLIISYSAGLPVTKEVKPSMFSEGALRYRDWIQKHLTAKCISTLLTVFEAADALERYFITSILGVIWEHCDFLVPTLRASLLNYISSYVDGSIKGSSKEPFLAGTSISGLLIVVTQNAKDFTASEIQRIVMSLYRVPHSSLVYYQPQLLKLTTKVINDNHNLAAPILLKLIRTWPRQSANKQLMFIEQIQAIFLALVQKKTATNIPPHQQWYYSDEDLTSLLKIRMTVFKQVCLCLESSHSEVSATAVRILDHPGVFFPFILFPKDLGPDGAPVETNSHQILGVIIRAFDKIGAEHSYLDIRKTIETLKRLVIDKFGAEVCRQAVQVLVDTDERHEAHLRLYDSMEEKLNAKLSRPSYITRTDRKARKPTITLSEMQRTKQRRDSLDSDDVKTETSGEGEISQLSEKVQASSLEAQVISVRARKSKAASISGGTMNLKILGLLDQLEDEKTENCKSMERRRSRLVMGPNIPLSPNSEHRFSDELNKNFGFVASTPSTIKEEEEPESLLLHVPSEVPFEDLGEDGEQALAFLEERHRRMSQLEKKIQEEF
mmetsp:Transcript_3306/g.6215  ORF Transcript_3306/g.6215 Transcript_3306/m.6215 type:complete len:807 (+) Transcript_3306:90-2510(+)